MIILSDRTPFLSQVWKLPRPLNWLKSLSLNSMDQSSFSPFAFLTRCLWTQNSGELVWRPLCQVIYRLYCPKLHLPFSQRLWRPRRYCCHFSLAGQQVTKPDLILKLEVEEPFLPEGKIPIWSFPGKWDWLRLWGQEVPACQSGVRTCERTFRNISGMVVGGQGHEHLRHPLPYPTPTRALSLGWCSPISFCTAPLPCIKLSCKWQSPGPTPCHFYRSYLPLLIWSRPKWVTGLGTNALIPDWVTWFHPV